jgi:hypothetical protein
LPQSAGVVVENEDIQYVGKRDSGTEGELKLMSDTELQIARQQMSEEKLRVLKQQTVVVGLRREGGRQLEEAVTLLDSMKDELTVMESHLDRLIFDAYNICEKNKGATE